MRPSRRSKSSVSAYSISGSAPGSSATSAIIAATRPGSSETSTRLAGPEIARSSSSADSGTTRLDAGLEQLREPPVEQRPVVEVGAQRDDDAQAAVRIGRGGLEAPEEVRPDGLVLDEREHLLELVDHEDELGPVGRAGAGGPRGGARARRARAAPSGSPAGPARRAAAPPRARPAGGRRGTCPRSASPRTRDRAAPERREQPGPDDGGLPAPARPDDGEEPGLRRAASTSCSTSSSRPKKSTASAFLERPQALVRVGDDRAGDGRREPGGRATRAPAGTPCPPRRRPPRPGAGPRAPGRRAP